MVEEKGNDFAKTWVGRGNSSRLRDETWGHGEMGPAYCKDRRNQDFKGMGPKCDSEGRAFQLQHSFPSGPSLGRLQGQKVEY